jgi:hypothetical protein
MILADQFEGVLKTADLELGTMRLRWEERHKVVEATYEKVLRELQKSKIDGEEFIRLRLRRQIEELRPLRERRDSLTHELTTHDGHRRQLLADWEDVKAAEFRRIEVAAKKVTRKLRDRVRVEVTMSGNREPLEKLLREEIGGNLTAVLERLQERAACPCRISRCAAGKAKRGGWRSSSNGGRSIVPTAWCASG